MKQLFQTILLVIATTQFVAAQFSRLHVKSPSGATVGITTGISNKVIGLNHDGTAGVISVTTLNGTTDYTPLKFSTAGLTRLTIFENGYVGIGVSGTPTAQLTVGGSIHAKEVKVNISAGAGPDYVFHPSYYLRSLKEVSLYINQHRHLPEVPSAAEMETKGVNMSEMNMLLLKKVEELTLYTIQLNEKVEELTQRLQQQESKINNSRK